MAVIAHTPKLWAIQFSNGWQYTPSEDAVQDAKRQGLPVVEYILPASDFREAVEDRDHFERALERIFYGSEDHAWKDARKALDTRPSRQE